MALCGAKKRDGTPCRAMAMPNGRCRLHGGKNTGAPKDNKNSLKHGIYAKAMTEEELSIVDEMTLGSVDNELKVCRIRLRRALLAEVENQEMEVVERLERPAILGGVPDYEEMIKELKFIKRDYSPIIDRLVARIESLERTRRELLSDADDTSEVSPVKIVIDVQDARKMKDDPAEA